MTDYLHALPSGYRIEEYELVRVLGSGGFGITYLGYGHHLDKAVAIKEYLPNDLAVRTDNQSVLPKSTQDKASASLLGAIDRALRVDEGERPQTIAEWREALAGEAAVSAYRRRKGTTKPTTHPATPPSQGSRNGLLSKILPVAMMLVCVGFALLYWWRQDELFPAAEPGDVILVPDGTYDRHGELILSGTFEMVLIPGDTFRMGDLSGVGYSWEQPVHSVTIRPFRMGKYEVTFAQDSLPGFPVVFFFFPVLPVNEISNEISK